VKRSRLARPQGKRDRQGRLAGALKTLLTREQERAVRRAWRAGKTQAEIAADLGVGQDLLRARLRDQLADLPRPGRGRRGGRRASDPTEEEIYGRLTLLEQARWTDEERDAKWQGPVQGVGEEVVP
jgi:hypothetical protein